MLLLNDSRGNKQVAVITSVVVAAAASYSPNLYQNYYYKEYREGIIEIAKTFFNNTLDQLVDKTMVAAEKGE